MNRCGDDCHPICDFCIYQRSDESTLREAEKRGDIPKGNRYTGNGYCMRRDAQIDLTSYCDDFYCFRAFERDRLQVVLKED